MTNNLRFYKYWIVLISFLSLLSIETSLVRAQDSFISNPLENNIPDPLLPNNDRPLNESEIKKIEATVAQLEKEGENLYQQGQSDAAFQTWYRELRLRQKLDRLNEVEALTRVGSIAWQDNRKEDLRNIENRSIEIQTESGLKLDKNLDLLNALGKVYRQIRSFDRAITIYQKILTYARDKQDVNTEKIALETTGKLYLSKFDYAKTIAIYEKLLNIARSQNDLDSEEIYLKQIIDSYLQISQPEKSLVAKQQLLERYSQTQQNELIPQLQIAIADDYRTLERLQESDRAYREAFNLAWSSQQYSVAAEALNKLGELYNAYDEKESALQVYEELLKVEGKISDFYGSIDTYDRIGQIHLELKNYELALATFERGLTIAKILNYQEDYFFQQIEKTKKQMNLS